MALLAIHAVRNMRATLDTGTIPTPPATASPDGIAAAVIAAALNGDHDADELIAAGASVRLRAHSPTSATPIRAGPAMNRGDGLRRSRRARRVAQERLLRPAVTAR